MTLGKIVRMGETVHKCAAKQAVKGVALQQPPTPVMPGLVPGIQSRALKPELDSHQCAASKAENTATLKTRRRKADLSLSRTFLGRC